MNYRIWDKISPINGVEAQEAMEALGILQNDEVYIIQDDSGADWIVQTFKNSPYPGKTIEEKAKAHLEEIKESLGPPQPTLQDYIEYYNKTQEVLPK